MQVGVHWGKSGGIEGSWQRGSDRTRGRMDEKKCREVIRRSIKIIYNMMQRGQDEKRGVDKEEAGDG